jgi:hypothetical protein
MAKEKFTGGAGLALARRAVRTLRDRGIYAHALLSVEHQQLAGRYVIRGLESGGSAGDVASIAAAVLTHTTCESPVLLVSQGSMSQRIKTLRALRLLLPPSSPW